jgi:uncharacterized protein
VEIYYDGIEGDRFDITTAFSFEENGELINIKNFTGALFKTDKIYFLQGEMEFELNCACDRCAEPAVINVKHTFEVGIEPEADVKLTGAEYEMTDGDGDIYTTPPDYIDLSEILRQEAVLQLPLKRLCRQDCEGEETEEYAGYAGEANEKPNLALKSLSSLKQNFYRRNR